MGFDAKQGTRSNSLGAPEAAGDLPPLVQHYIDSWPAYLQAIRSAEDALAAIQAGESALRSGRYQTAWTWSPEGRKSLRGLANDIASAICEYARQVYVGGVSELFSTREENNQIERSRAVRNPETPDFAALWRSLDQTFGNGRGAALYLVHIARKIRKTIGLFHSDDNEHTGWRNKPSIERGGVKFTTYNHCLSRASGDREYKFNSAALTELTTFLRGLQVLMGDPEVSAQQVAALEQRMDQTVRGAPQRLTVGSWRWTFLMDNTELWIPQDLALEIRARLDEVDYPAAAA